MSKSNQLNLLFQQFFTILFLVIENNKMIFKNSSLFDYLNLLTLYPGQVTQCELTCSALV